MEACRLLPPLLVVLAERGGSSRCCCVMQSSRVFRSTPDGNHSECASELYACGFDASDVMLCFADSPLARALVSCGWASCIRSTGEPMRELRRSRESCRVQHGQAEGQSEGKDRIGYQRGINLTACRTSVCNADLIRKVQSLQALS